MFVLRSVRSLHFVLAVEPSWFPCQRSVLACLLGGASGVFLLRQPFQLPTSTRQLPQSLFPLPAKLRRRLFLVCGRHASTHFEGILPHVTSLTRPSGETWCICASAPHALQICLLLEDCKQKQPATHAAMQAFWHDLVAKYGIDRCFPLPPGLDIANMDLTLQAAPAAFHIGLFADNQPASSRSSLSRPSSWGTAWCRMCDWVGAAAEWTQHVETHGGFAAYRAALIATDVASWPRPIAPEEIRANVQTYTRDFHTIMGHSAVLCACCATESPRSGAHIVNLRDASFAVEQLHPLLSAVAYHSRLSASAPSPSTMFSGMPLSAILEACVPVPAEVVSAASPEDGWILHMDTRACEAWKSSSQTADPLLLPLCSDCHRWLTGCPPRLPPQALANGNLCLPLPPELLDLTLGEQLFLARGHTVQRLHTLPAQSAPEARQQGLRGNVISFPQSSAEVFSRLPPDPALAADFLTVIFPDASLANLSGCPEYTIRREKVFRALLWLRAHNPYYADIDIDQAALDALPEHGHLQHMAVQGTGPPISADIGPSHAQAMDTSAGMPLAAAVLDVEGESLLPAEFWREALRATDQEQAVVVVPHGRQPMDTFTDGFWTLCFPVLFPYGDGLPNALRLTKLPLQTWARHLLRRRDRTEPQSPWALDVPFISTLFSVLHRRRLLHAVRAKLSSPGFATYSSCLQNISPDDFHTAARIVGQHGGIREALRCLATKASFFSFALASFFSFRCCHSCALCSEAIQTSRTMSRVCFAVCSWCHVRSPALMLTETTCAMRSKPCSSGTAYLPCSSPLTLLTLVIPLSCASLTDALGM